MAWRSIKSSVRLLLGLALIVSGVTLFLFPGLKVLHYFVFDPGLTDKGGSQWAFDLHKSLSKRYEKYARDRLQSGEAEKLTPDDIAETEWPLFGSVFYLWATENLQKTWEANPRFSKTAPKLYARGAVDAAARLVLEPSQARWVKEHWGDEHYLKRENVFYRMLLLSAMTAHHNLTGSAERLPFLREQAEGLSKEIDASPFGLLDDYPAQCYPADVVAAIAAIRRADEVLGTDHREFAARAIRGFEGVRVGRLGLPAYAASSQSGFPMDLSRGCANSYFTTFAPQIWPEKANDWFTAYLEHFWQSNAFAAGFREFPRSQEHSEYYFDVDAGPVVGGLGTAATAFGIGAARTNGRYDIARPLSAQALAASWPLPGGMLLMPRLLSNAAHAPLLGEAAVVFQLSQEPHAGANIVRGGRTPLCFYLMLALYILAAAVFLRCGWRLVRPKLPLVQPPPTRPSD